jgi:predicted phosphodiesterase
VAVNGLPRRDVRRAALLSDVHGNAVALAAVLADLEREDVDVLVFGGDLTWGPLPRETLDLVHPIANRSMFVSGNAERALLELAGGEFADPTERERWMQAQHDADALAFIGSFVHSVVLDVAGLGAVRVCHGSPRSDEELVTPATPDARMRALLEGVDERILVTAHTHLQFDRDVVGVRSVNAGSVGMPYQGEPGAYWALLGPDVELRRTSYDLEEAVRRYRATDDPRVEEMVEILLEPPQPAEVIEHAEQHEFAG